MTSVGDLRSAFISYFQGLDHIVLPSAPLVPRADPSLLFINAGMAPLKAYFTGAEKPPAPRAVTAQKCVRAGGKHNDLDNVGYTARHLTFFEMLGNFSFGDYFKEAAIDYAWTFVTRELGLAPARLMASVHTSDEEAARLWKKIAGLPDSRIVALEENMWSMGDTGPFGPNTEIFFDHGDGVAGGPPGSPEEDGDRFVEIWNLVFMQFEQMEDGRTHDLPKPCVDTGLGLERTALVLQGVTSVFATDLFTRLIAASEEVIGVSGANATSAHQVIADHLRAAAFLIADGVGPSNEGRGYVLRRIIRRAVRHAHQLGAHEPVMHRLVPALVETMGEAWSELVRAEPVIEATLRGEEERFLRTLGRGMGLLEEATARLKPGQALSGETAFKLYDTYGFPLDLTRDVIRARGLKIDEAGFEAAMDRQREKGREAWTGSGQTGQDKIWLDLREHCGATVFLGYETDEAETPLLTLVRDGVEIETAEAGEEVFALFAETPFYAESGGQAGDRGRASWAGGEAEVLDCQKEAGELHVHRLKIRSGALVPGARVRLAVDPGRRAATRLNHSAAHLLHAALKHVLGPHVAQKGQMVDAERMRFDFSHGAPLTAAEIVAIETEVNQVIGQNLAAETRIMAPEAAIASGAVGLFGEKYGESVRVLSLGRGLEGEGAYSVELCGGTHVARTGDLGLFVIVSEQGIAAGVRRIEALTGERARRWLSERAEIARRAAEALRAPINEVPARLEALEAQRRRLEKALAEAKRRLAMGEGGGAAGPQSEEVAGTRFLGQVLEGVGGKDLRPMAETYRAKVPDGVIVLNGVLDGKVASTVVVTGKARERFNAVELARTAVAAMGGQGAGGKPDFAQGGASGDPLRAAQGVAAVKAAIASA
ncbi:MAG: alanine--tRNA ligase [Caulobacteraceae bacterium]